MNDQINIPHHKGGNGVGIRWKLFACLAVFIAFMLVVIYLLQICFLDRFYENSKMREMEQMANALSGEVEKETLDETVKKYAVEESTYICVYKVSKDYTFVNIADSTTLDGCLINITSVMELYNKTKSVGGIYVEKKGNLIHDGSFQDNPLGPGRDDLFQSLMAKHSVNTVYCRVVSGTDGETDYLILLNTELAPLNATVNTLKMQFIWIVVILAAGSLLLALLLSRIVTRPIERMNASAKLLAEGRYDADFSGSGFREIRELGDSLNFASGELSKTDRLQKELLANISHDLRTPLTMIKGYGEVMRDIPGENTAENVQVIIDEATRLSDLVNDLLDISKLKAGTRLPKKEVFNLTQTVRDTMHRYEKLTGHDGYHVDFKADEDVEVYADRTMILQVVYNLINNAINYAGEDKTVLVGQQVSAGVVRISVTDHGIGIEPDQIPLIWDRYYKIDRVHRRAMVGTGLGLSIVKGILESHNAVYGVESTVGVGSTFWFELNVSGQAEDGTPAQTGLEQGSGNHPVP